MADHSNIVKLIEVLASRTKIYLVLEYIKGGELWDLISNIKLSHSNRCVWLTSMAEDKG